MGNDCSTLSLPLEQWSSEDLAAAVRGLGSKYEELAQQVLDHGVDGGIVNSEEELQETLQDLDVSRLHSRILTKAWHRVKEREEECKRQLGKDKQRPAFDAQRYRQAVQAMDLTPETPKEELVGFQKVSEKAMEKLSAAVYAGIHLWGSTGQNGGSASLRETAKTVGLDHWIQVDQEHSQCYSFLTQSQKTYVTIPAAATVDQDDNTPQQPPVVWDYHACALLDEHDTPVGVLCTLVPPVAGLSVEQVQEILCLLKQQAEQEVAVRKVLVARKKSLKRQMQMMPEEESKDDGDLEVLPDMGLIRAVKVSEIRQRQQLHPVESEALPCVDQNMREAAQTTRPDDLALFPDDFYFDATPVGRGEMERLAVSQSCGFEHIRPNDPVGVAMKKLVRMACVSFGTEYGEIYFFSNTVRYGLSRYIGTQRMEQVINYAYQGRVRSYDESTGQSWLADLDRKGTVCNYTMAMRKTFVVHDITKDKSFSHYFEGSGWSFYAAAPIWVRGQPVMALNLTDFRPKPHFGIAHEVQLEQFAGLIAQQLETWLLRKETESLEQARLSASLSGQERLTVPDGHAAILFTDIQGSTTLWETDPDAMQNALDLHNHIMRQCCTEFHGYEIMTEGDAFHIAFHDAIDAVQFALKVQEALHEAPWSKEILIQPDAVDDKSGWWRGLRVRMGIAYGQVTRRKNEVTGQYEYAGPAVFIAKSLEHMSHGGQILVSGEVWNECVHISESKLRSPQVLDLGSHVLMTGAKMTDGVTVKRVLQILPDSLAVDYYSSRKEDGSFVTGRQFPPPLTKKQLTASFEDAPYANNHVAILFVYTSEIEKKFDNAGEICGVLSRWIGTLLSHDSLGSGYQCKNFMVALASASSAVKFGLRLLGSIADGSASVNREIANLIQVGVLEGKFTTMAPNPATGRADYFGKVVNRAARVAGAAECGTVYLGYLNLQEAPKLEAEDIELKFVGCKALKGVQAEAALYQCTTV